MEVQGSCVSAAAVLQLMCLLVAMKAIRSVCGTLVLRRPENIIHPRNPKDRGYREAPLPFDLTILVVRMMRPRYPLT